MSVEKNHTVRTRAQKHVRIHARTNARALKHIRTNAHARCHTRTPGGIDTVDSSGAGVVFVESAARWRDVVGIVASLRPLVEDWLPHESAAPRKTHEGLVPTRVEPKD